jgi:hypothetical protein
LSLHFASDQLEIRFRIPAPLVSDVRGAGLDSYLFPLPFNRLVPQHELPLQGVYGRLLDLLYAFQFTFIPQTFPMVVVFERRQTK